MHQYLGVKSRRGKSGSCSRQVKEQKNHDYCSYTHCGIAGGIKIHST